MQRTTRVLLFLCLLVLPGIILAQKKDEKKDKTEDTSKQPLPLKPERKIRLQTDEGTWLNLDVSPDGKTIAFDMMGDLYLLPMAGGQAERITHGMAYETHPKFSPDGNHLAFTSDSSGAENIWIMELDTKEFTQITKDTDKHYQSVEWTPDGNYIVASKGGRNLKLHLYHKDGGGGMQLIKKPDNLKVVEPAFGPDERYIWFAQRRGAWNYNAQLPQYQLAVYDRKTGEMSTKTNRYGSAFSPCLSPDGKWLVYGSRYNTQTGLVKRNLETGEEDWLAYPVQRDEQESIAPLGVYPAMSFTPDSEALIAYYGGKIHRIALDGSTDEIIPFEVDVELDFGPRVRFDFPISDDPEMVATQIRDPQRSPDGSKIAFTVLNRLYVMDYPDGNPKRVTDNDFTEAMPVWSPDGNDLAFVTWEGDKGHIYRVSADGGTPRQLTNQSGTYMDLAWDATTDRIVCLAGPAQAYQNAIGPSAFGAAENLVWIPADGGDLTLIKPANGRENPHFVERDDRIYLYHGGHGLISIRWDGTDEKEHLSVTGITTFPALVDQNHCMMVEQEQEPQRRPSSASLLTMAPKGDRALAQINNEIYVVTVPMVGGETPKISVAKAKNAAFPSWQLTELGGEWPHWSADGNTVNWSLGNAYFSYDLAEAERMKEKIEAAKKAKEAADEDNKKKKKNKKKGDDEEDEDEEEEGYKPDEIRIKVKVGRDLPKGSILLSGARIITMNGDEIFESGDLLVVNNRIQQVGTTGSIDVGDGVDVMDMSGKTIVPGFVDTHAHMWPNWGLHKNQIWIYAANLAYGVTTTRDPQTATTDVLTYADMVDAGDMLGPRVYSTGPGVGFWAYRMTSKAHASRVLKQYSDYYNTKTIKMYLTGNRQHRQWIIEAAKEQGLMPTTEGGLDFKLNMTQLIDGYPGHEHAFPIYPVYDDVIKLVAESKMAYTPTLLVAYGGPWAENYFYATEDVQGDEKLNYFTPKSELDAKSRRRPAWFMEEEHIFQRHAEFVNDLVEAGGIAGVGSHGQLQGLGYHWELWAMQAGGLDEHNALKAATILGATAIGLDKDLGSIASGKLADLLILDDNPLEDIRHTNTITHVMKNGRLYEGDTLKEVWPRQQEAPAFNWQSGAPGMGLPGMKR